MGPDDIEVEELLSLHGFVDLVRAHAPVLLDTRRRFAERARSEIGTREPVRDVIKQVLVAAGPVSSSVVEEWHQSHLQPWIATHLARFTYTMQRYSTKSISNALDVILDTLVLQDAGAEVDLECVTIGFATVDKHQRTLASKRMRLVNEDEYGTVDTDAWEREKQYFVETVVSRACGTLWAFSGEMKSLGVDVVLDNVSHYIDEVTELLPSPTEELTPADFEAACASVLRNAGWTASVTKASGDQGVDIIAKRSGRALAVQCKLYSSPVGNKAVQEVAAGRVHYSADLGVVVSDAGFTPSARALASTNNVLLLSMQEFSDFARDFASG